MDRGRSPALRSGTGLPLRQNALDPSMLETRRPCCKSPTVDVQHPLRQPVNRAVAPRVGRRGQALPIRDQHEQAGNADFALARAPRAWVPRRGAFAIIAYRRVRDRHEITWVGRLGADEGNRSGGGIVTPHGKPAGPPGRSSRDRNGGHRHNSPGTG